MSIPKSLCFDLLWILLILLDVWIKVLPKFWKFSSIFFFFQYILFGGSDGKDSMCCAILGFDPRVRKIPWRKEWLPILVFLPGESQGQASLVGYCPWGRKRVENVLVTNTFTVMYF